MTFPIHRGRVVNEDTIKARDAASVIVIEMIESDAVQLLGSRLGRLVPVNMCSAFEEKTCIHEHRGQREAPVPQKRKAPGFGKL
jgi:hypothetical protein